MNKLLAHSPGIHNAGVDGAAEELPSKDLMRRASAVSIACRRGKL